MEITDETIDLLLGALADQLQTLGSHAEIVVIGGSALTALGLVRRATRDVDLLAVAENGELRRATDLLKWGLPEAFMSRVVTRSYGTALLVHFASRYDQIHFKLFAMADQGGGRHEADLRALSPTRGELIAGHAGQ